MNNVTTRTKVLAGVSICALLLLFFPGGSKRASAPPLKPPRVGEFTHKIVAVGDLHGDFLATFKVLHMTGAISDNGNWTGNVNTLVQTGDIVDRGDDTLKIYDFMERLRAEARGAGGQVLSHLGNHEWMNMIGDWRYVYPSEIATFGSVEDRQKMISSGWVGQAWRDNYTTTSRLPLHPSLGPVNTDYDPSKPSSDLSHAAISFVHGGLSHTYADLTPFPSKINSIGQSLLRKLQDRKQPPPHPPNPYPGLPSDATQAEHEMYDANGPVWYRGWALGKEADVCAVVDDALKRTGTRRMVMGHTPDFEKIVSRCGGKIIIIDTGMSRAYGGVLSALSITYTLSPSSSFAEVRSQSAKWVEREVVNAIYEHHTTTLVDSTREVVGNFW